MSILHARWPYVGAAAMASCVTYFLRTLRWRVILNAEHRFGVGTVFSANMAGYLGNNFLPARAGEVIRSFILSSQSPLSKTYVLTTALAERTIDAVVLVLWGSVILLGIDPKPRWVRDLSWGTTALAVGGVFAIFILPRTGKLCENIIQRLPLPAGIRERLLHLAGQVLSGLRVFHDGRRLAAFTVMTAMIWAIDASAAIIGGHAFGLNFTFSMASLLMCGLGLGSAIAPTPGYVGTYQSVAVAVLTPFGISRDAALAYILVAQAVAYVVVLVLGLPAILRYRAWGRRGG